MADVFLTHDHRTADGRPTTDLAGARLGTDVDERRSRARSYDVTPDGERFLLTKLPGEQSRPRIVVVLNWFAELTAKFPR